MSTLEPNMPENTIPIVLSNFITERTKVIRNLNVLTEIDLSDLFEIDLENLQLLINNNIQSFKDDSIIVLKPEESKKFDNAGFAFTDPGIFVIAGLIKSKRAIMVYVKLVEILVNRLQNRACEIATSYQSGQS